MYAWMNIVGPILLGLVLAWAVYRNWKQRTPRQEEIAEDGARDLRHEIEEDGSRT